ncbi:MAG: TlpA family protein disulfide reductase [Planctomycetes bacterium]|jgi:thiol-disulfide isomerase/thioredoxin|nr:TlpA family protein disulfide reductase [Planctomycetota bacterium]
MRKLLVPLFLSSLCGVAIAQTPADATGKPAVTAQAGAEAAYKELGDAHMTRMRAVKRGDTEGRAEAMKLRMADLATFVEKFPTSIEAAKAHLEIAQLAMQNKDEDGARAAIAKVDAGKLDLQGNVSAAMAAKTIGAEDQKKAFLDMASTKAKTIDERLELVTGLRMRLKDEAAADQLMASIEASAKTDEDKATVLMGKAVMSRRSSRDDKGPYKELIAETAKLYPATKAGKMAASKVAAANLKVGGDPVPFTTTDMDGKSVSVADYKGKVLLIDFWATWCGPCMAELPHVLEAYQAYHDQGFEILGISLDRDTDKEKLVNTIKDRGMSWRHVYDGKYWQAEVAQMHDVNSIPFTLLIGKDGKVVGMNLRGEKLGEAVKAALEAK